MTLKRMIWNVRGMGGIQDLGGYGIYASTKKAYSDENKVCLRL